MALSFDRADPVRDRDALIRFNVDYLGWLQECIDERYGVSLTALLGEPIPTYVASALAKLCAAEPPEGVFYLVRLDGSPVGMGGLRKGWGAVGEIKRIYASPAARGQGVGAAILDRLIADARDFGHEAVVLDSGPFMTSAHRLYEAAGFEDIAAYPNAEVPQDLHYDWRFMRLTLT